MPNENSYEVALQKSNAIREGLAKTPEKFTMLTGDRPTGRVGPEHLVGAAELHRARLGPGQFEEYVDHCPTVTARRTDDQTRDSTLAGVQGGGFGTKLGTRPAT